MTLTRCCNGLMMYSIHLDESATHMSKVARPSHLCVLFDEKLDSLLDRLDNRRTMHGSQSVAIDCWCGNQNDTHYCSGITPPNYKYILHSVLMIISHSFFSRLGFPFPALGWLAMEDRRGTKRPRSPSAEGSSSPSDDKTTPPALFGSPLQSASSLEISLRRPCSPVFAQGGPSRNILVIELSSCSNEEDFFTDTSRDVEFARRLFGDLNRDLLGPPGDGKVIVLNDSDEEEEVREDTATDTDVAPSAIVKSSTPAAFAADADEDPGKMQDDNSDDLAPGQDMGRSSGDGDEAGSP
jgi:hypothetical protein